MKTLPRVYFKRFVEKHFLVEVAVFDIVDIHRYPNGIKYGLICKNILTGARVLFDNHFPKGDHFHIDDQEYDYQYVSYEILYRDFETMVSEHFGVIL